MNINNVLLYLETPGFSRQLMLETLKKYKNSTDWFQLLCNGHLCYFPSKLMTIGEIKAFLCLFDGFKYRYRLTFRSCWWFERYLDNSTVVDLSKFDKFEYELVFCCEECSIGSY